MLSREEIKATLTRWFRFWNNHDLNGVIEQFHRDVLFEHWTGAKVMGKEALHQVWSPWFKNHESFRLTTKDLFIDEEEQKVLYQWQLDWPSREKGFEGKPERRNGVNIIHFMDGKIRRYNTYSKTTIEIKKKRVRLIAHTE